MNIMYFRLQPGEEAKSLRNMAIENFPNVDLKEMEIWADDYNKRDVLYHMIDEIKRGMFSKLYITDISVFGRNYAQSCGIISELSEARPDFEIETKGGCCYRVSELSDTINSAIMKVFYEAEGSIGIDENEEGMTGMQGI